MLVDLNELKQIILVLNYMRLLKGIVVIIVLCTSNAVNAQNKSILLITLYQSSQFENPLLDSTLHANGYTVQIITEMPDAWALDSILNDFSQLWLISDYKRHMDTSHLMVCAQFLGLGKSLYILADNEPYDADADFVSQYFTGAKFAGNFIADKGAYPAPECDMAQHGDLLYEGFTVSEVSIPESVKPQYVGSDGQVCVASFDNGRYRILLDGGFTRLYTKWNIRSAEYFLDAAHWLEVQYLNHGQTDNTVFGRN